MEECRANNGDMVVGALGRCVEGGLWNSGGLGNKEGGLRVEGQLRRVEGRTKIG